jgi:hypothetical protein
VVVLIGSFFFLLPTFSFLAISVYCVDHQIRNQQQVRLFEQINKYMKQQQKNETEDRKNSKKDLFNHMS